MRSVWLVSALVLLAAAPPSAEPALQVLRVQPDSRPLPDADALFAAVRGNLARAEREDYRYAYKERRTDVHTNPFGRIGTGDTRLFEVYPSPIRGLTYRRLVAEAGVPLPPEELARQDREYRERAAEVMREIASRSEDEARRREEEAQERRERAQKRVDDVIGALQFSVAGRTSHEGRPAILLEFTPRPGANPETRDGDIASKFAGKIWVDEASAEVMRVEAEAIDSISFGFGIIARLGEGTLATLTRRPVPGGLWLPTELTLSGRGRAVLFRRLDLDYQVEWFDYRLLDGESATPFLDARVDGQTGGGPQ